MRILLVSQMYPGPDAPDLGTFVAQVERALVARGHEVERAVLDTRAGGKLRYLELARRTLRAGRPDVVYAHFLVPSGLIAALAGRAPLVVTAHGRDVRNIGELPGVAAATRLVVARAATVVCVSEYLRRELETRLPAAAGKTEVVSSGVDLERFAIAPAPDGPTRYLCVGALSERKNVVRLADAFASLDGAAQLTFAGDGPLRARLEGRANVHVLGPVPHDEIPALLAEALRAAAELPVPNEAARAAATEHDVRRQAEKIEALLLRAAAAGRPA
jgi:glycosyltransferase involved in cell wall biosynthesis